MCIAGNGKSQCIDATLAFAAAWNRPHTVYATSFSGNAAQNVGGLNIHQVRIVS
jgi:hypothetical protein